MYSFQKTQEGPLCWAQKISTQVRSQEEVAQDSDLADPAHKGTASVDFNAPDRNSGRIEYTGNSAECDWSLVNSFVAGAERISFKELELNCRTELLEEALGYDEHFPMSLETTLSCWRGVFCGQLAYCLVQSGVHFFWVSSKQLTHKRGQNV